MSTNAYDRWSNGAETLGVEDDWNLEEYIEWLICLKKAKANLDGSFAEVDRRLLN
ncbi:hypothetical protein FVEN_g12863 [Fusarium venenatum]|nr:hypothetical protein FVEN_g12863 [Fusarium venenatum]